tara:strand:- start:1234 stop:2322 length:1089 start_codon:yes stop_codon:yes gene_type:complete
MQKLAIVTGITGQDGSYLAQYLLLKGYKVYAGVRRISMPLSSNSNLKNFINHPNLTLINMDFLDSGSIKSFVETVGKYCNGYLKLMDNYIEVYNLAAQSHVGESFKIPAITHQVNAIGVITLLESLRHVFNNRFRFYQASTSELYGNAATVDKKILNEESEFKPISPYAISKLSAFLTVKNFREAHGIYAVNGILFNHESPRRGIEFVTRKITNGLAQYATGQNEGPIQLGNIKAKRDWGDARDYIKAMYMMLQLSDQNKVKDYVVATGETYSVKDFCDLAFKKIGVTLKWFGEGIHEVALNNDDEVMIEISSKFYRPSDVEYLLGDSSLIQSDLNWKRENSFKTLVFDMVEHDIELCKGKS